MLLFSGEEELVSALSYLRLKLGELLEQTSVV
jgi:hypothetical protein